MPFPQYPTKHRKEPLFRAAEFHRYEARRTGTPLPRPPPNVILTFGRTWRRYLGRKYRGTLDPRSGVYGVSRTVGVSIVGGPGAPFAALVVEELAALRVKRFLIVGMAGSLQRNLRVGSLVLCSKALRDEGTSHHYLRPGRYAYPSPRLTARVRAALKREEIPHEEGATWTTDAPYRETIPEIRRYRGQGILTVEMEAAAVFSVARFRECEAAALLVISDHVDEHGWEPRFHESRNGLRKALALAIAALGREPS